MWEDFDYIATDKCDSCERRSVGVMLHCRGTPVMFLCANPMCGGHLAFERTARDAIDRWLAGECSPFEQHDAAADLPVNLSLYDDDPFHPDLEEAILASLPEVA